MTMSVTVSVSRERQYRPASGRCYHVYEYVYVMRTVSVMARRSRDVIYHIRYFVY